MGLPPDRRHLRTEHRNAASMKLDDLDTRASVELIVEDHGGVADAVRAAAGALADLIDAVVERMRSGGRLIYLGAGTSGRLGVLDAAECPPTFRSDPEQVVGIIAGGDACLKRSAEAREDDPRGATETLETLRVGPGDTVVGIAAGGTTLYVLGGLELAGKRGANTALITCVRPHEPPACNHLVVLETGPELLTGSTRLKAGSATKLALNTITTTVFVQLGKVYSNLMVDVKATNDKLTDRAIRILETICPELSRTSAADTLHRAGGDLKAAIVMQRLGVDLDAATELLDMHDGMLRAVLE